MIIQPGELKEIAIDLDCPKVNYIEHTLITLSLQTSNRGQMEITLKSPSGKNLAVVLVDLTMDIFS